MVLWGDEQHSAADTEKGMSVAKHCLWRNWQVLHMRRTLEVTRTGSIRADGTIGAASGTRLRRHGPATKKGLPIGRKSG